MDKKRHKTYPRAFTLQWYFFYEILCFGVLFFSNPIVLVKADGFSAFIYAFIVLSFTMIITLTLPFILRIILRIRLKKKAAVFLAILNTSIIFYLLYPPETGLQCSGDCYVLLSMVPKLNILMMIPLSLIFSYKIMTHSSSLFQCLFTNKDWEEQKEQTTSSDSNAPEHENKH